MGSTASASLFHKALWVHLSLSLFKFSLSGSCQDNLPRAWLCSLETFLSSHKCLPVNTAVSLASWVLQDPAQTCFCGPNLIPTASTSAAWDGFPSPQPTITPVPTPRSQAPCPAHPEWGVRGIIWDSKLTGGCLCVTALEPLLFGSFFLS